jgi:hypothetical protein
VPQSLLARADEVTNEWRNVCYWHKADIQPSPGNVRFWNINGRQS